MAVNLKNVRTLMLWTSFAGGPRQLNTWTGWLQAFSVENTYLAFFWMTAIAHPIGQFPDLLIWTVLLVSDGLSNAHFCSLPFAKSGLVSLSPAPLGVAGVLSAFMTNAAGLVKGAGNQAGDAAGPRLTCQAVLWLWQLIGWCLTCHVVLVAEIMRRRAFLRSDAARGFLGPAHMADALSWPCSRVKALQSFFIMSFAIAASTSAVWLVTTSGSD